MKKEIQGWASIPMLRVLVALVVGILLYEPLTPHISILLAAPGLLGFIFRYWIASHLLQGRDPTWAMAILSCYMILGYGLMYLYDVKNLKNWPGDKTIRSETYIAKTLNDNKPSKNGFNSEIRLLAVHSGENGWNAVSALALLHHQTPLLQSGKYFLVSSSLRSLDAGPGRKGAFIGHLKRKNIFHQMNADSNQLVILRTGATGNETTHFRRILSTILDSLYTDCNTRAMAGALLIGERVLLAPEINAAYVNTGVVHVIAISGMHLALIYMMLAGMLRFLHRLGLKWLYTLTCIAFLWLYASICGFSPSVVRSAWMFSFMLVGELFEKSRQTGNSLAASAVVMLCANPSLLWDIGFQLSYAAVGSLLIYQASIARIYQPENNLLRQCWGVLATTIAAQILTAPLVIFHFEQFPLIFLISNLVAVPLSGLILALTGASCILFPTGFAPPVASLAETLIRFMNSRILALGELEFASLGNLYLDIPNTIILYILILTFTLWIRLKKR